ncbi:type VI secretion system tube protein TssD [Rapidithrix thailandica]|uniref:Type VI secretion system tube protein TssD n=1 Tax=Rapidithrix thailandica TaxID=413964 RepID=A0AAW9SGH4_9BACT
MSLLAKMYVEDQEYTILDFKFKFTRSVDESGKPMGKPNGTLFDILFETTSDQSFFEWSTGMDMAKKVKIVVSPVTQDSKSRVLELYDVHCVFFRNHFNGVNNQSMTTNVKLSPAILYDGGVKILEHYWKETDLSAQDTPVTTIEPEKELEIISIHYEDENGNRLEKIGKGKVNLVLETRNGAGKKVDVQLDNRNQEGGEEGVLRGVSIVGDITKMEVEVASQEQEA